MSPETGIETGEKLSSKYRVLIFGASYGSLLATKLALAGHDVKLVCLPEEADLINASGTIVRMPVRGHSTLVEIASGSLPGTVTADVPSSVDPADFDLVVLGMQEPQYRAPGVRDLLDKVARARVPAMSIMNMPPLPYLERLPGVSAEGCRDCYTEPEVWEHFDSSLITLCSPDPQAFRPPEEGPNVLQVRLPTNFKSARFESEEQTAMLREIEAGIDACRIEIDGADVELPVKLRVHESVMVPLAKWSMLLAGNYRCITPEGMRPIKEAVYGDIDASRAMYEWVLDVCRSLGASEDDLVPFDKYAGAADGLESPSSVARALFGGAQHIERVDCLVKTIAAQKGMHNDQLDEIVALVDAKLEANRAVPV